MYRGLSLRYNCNYFVDTLWSIIYGISFSGNLTVMMKKYNIILNLSFAIFLFDFMKIIFSCNGRVLT